MIKYDLYEYTDYKLALKDRIAFLREEKLHSSSQSSAWTLKKLADKIPVQYTFLSKVLNSSDAHLNEDHLFRAAQALDFLPDEIDFLILLRSASVTTESRRKDFLIKKLDHIKKQRSVSADYKSFSSSDLRQELNYLLNPLCVLVHIALWLPEIQKNPHALCSLLGIPHTQLKEIFETLERNEMIELGERPLEVKKVHQWTAHFSREHPLMRIHQTALKTSLQNRLAQTPEDSKESFFVTFSMDDEAFQKIQALFKKFIVEVQQIKLKCKDEGLYQMSFDLLKWF